MSKIGKLKKVTKKIRRELTKLNKTHIMFLLNTENTNEHDLLSKEIADYSNELRKYLVSYKSITGLTENNKIYDKVFEGLVVIPETDLKTLHETNKKYKEMLSAYSNKKGKIITYSSNKKEVQKTETKKINMEDAFKEYVQD